MTVGTEDMAEEQGRHRRCVDGEGGREKHQKTALSSHIFPYQQRKSDHGNYRDQHLVEDRADDRENVHGTPFSLRWSLCPYFSIFCPFSQGRLTTAFRRGERSL